MLSTSLRCLASPFYVKHSACLLPNHISQASLNQSYIWARRFRVYGRTNIAPETMVTTRYLCSISTWSSIQNLPASQRSFFCTLMAPKAFGVLSNQNAKSSHIMYNKGCCSYAGTSTIRPPSIETRKFHEEKSKLKQEFERALKYFQCNSEALVELVDMPKMDPNGVYANHNLRLDRINVYGFDYDYTLAHYTENLQPLIYDLAKKHLVEEHRYPESCLSFQYDPQFPIRGLYYDKKMGYLLKLDFFHSAELSSCYFGRRCLTRDELEAVYGGKHVGVEHMPNLASLMDLFCLSEVCLISDVIQHFVDEKIEFDPAYVYEDVKRSIDFVHRSGLLHSEILHEPQKYLVKNNEVIQMLRTLKERGKKTFILTNSPFPFVDSGMRYLFQEDGQDGRSWMELFDVVVAFSDKPNFYTSERPFRHYVLENDKLAFTRVDRFEPHSVYYHGCLKQFIEITKWRGSEVLYFGDHLYSDLRGPAKAGWRTAAIIRELEREIKTQNEDKYRFQQAKYHMLQELLGKFHGLPVSTTEEEEKLLEALRGERQNARQAMVSMFNPYFGSTFLTDTGKESAFAYNVQRYADFYTSRLENLVTYSTEAWLCSPFDVKMLPHHVKVAPPKLVQECCLG